MFENFRVPSRVSIAGYRWDCEKPEKVVCIIHGIGAVSYTHLVRTSIKKRTIIRLAAVREW